MTEYQDYSLAAMHDYLYSRLELMQDKKKATENKVPNMVTKGELFAQIEKDAKDVLNQMFRDKIIKVHKTIHAPNQDFVELITVDNGETK